MKMFLRLFFVLLSASVSQGFAQGTAFTYQGQLEDGTNAASGIYDLQFAIFDSASSGNLVAGPLTNSTTGITNGLFTVSLDFGSGVFTGARRWLEISVRTNGASDFSILSARQQLTASPYAISAGSIVSGGISAGTYASPVTFNNLANQFSGAFSGNVITTNINSTQFITNGSSAATIQSVFNSNTNNGAISIAPGDYDLSAAITITNGCYIQGNGAWFHWTNATALALAGAMLDTGTNFSKQITIDGLGLDGGIYSSYNSSSFYDSANLIPNGFHGDTFWSNRTGLRIEASGGAVVKNCTFAGWSGNAILGLNIGDNGGSIYRGRLTIVNNTFHTNFASIFMPGSRFEVSGYNNNPSSGWVDNEPDYSLIEGNQIDTSQNGIVVDSPNVEVHDNICVDNYFSITMCVLAGKATISGNNLNHSFAGIFIGTGYGGGGDQHPTMTDNTMWADTYALLGCNASNMVFRANHISCGITVTNYGGGASSGQIVDNDLFSGAWDSAAIPINIAPGVIVQGNMDQSAQSTDGSVAATMALANTAALILTNAPSLSIIPTNGGILWHSNVVAGTNGLFFTVNSNGVGVTYRVPLVTQ